MRAGNIVIVGALVSLISPEPGISQQISVPRIEQMPNLPSPYLMRNWKQVAQEYDSLVFDLNLTGTYLPLSWINTNTVNYPLQNSFGLHTVVGTTAPTSAEAINCIPAIISSSLNGIDKTSQFGRNWVLMSQEWFNRRPAQNVYKNHPVDDTGDDWWYITMPNVFFYQLYSLYPSVGNAQEQFTTVAQRWYDAVRAMGGNAAPWNIPDMDHRGWMFDTMTPYDAGVHEPEAAGAIAWILYNAFLATHDTKYRIGAEWSLEFLDARPTNPSYELQLPYGVLTAARMNAEVGTDYDVEKMLNWCFDVGPLRSWGAMVGTWGGNDCSGLIGEVNGSNNYAFAMNTFEQVGALLPLVRYDDRFARAIGKWVLNAANASRLFYSAFLPQANQDSYAWDHQYDSASVIAHEAIRQFNGGISPYATGDAIAGGWGATNLALYGSSHAGILGAIIDTTNVSGVLKLDALRTDYFGSAAYPTLLYYNPHPTSAEVVIDVGPGPHDVYDAVTNSYLLTAVSGTHMITVPADNAVLVTFVPSGGVETQDFGKLLVNGVVVDYHSGTDPVNYPPRIKSLAADSTVVLVLHTTHLYCTATDRDNDSISYQWSASTGAFQTVSGVGTWTAPDSECTATIRCIVTDGHGVGDTATITLQVLTLIDNPPVIDRLVAQPRKLDLNGSSSIACVANDPDNDSLAFVWTTNGGILSGSGPVVGWTAPSSAGNYQVSCEISDGKGGSTKDSLLLEVRDFSTFVTGDLVAFFPFNGDANDASGNGNNGIVHGATPVPDRLGQPSSAYAFNGTSWYIDVPNVALLNFTGAITVNFWMNAGALYTREQYPISHGNWENRWKVSISNGRLRWTVKTDAAITDLDAESPVVVDSLYNVTVRYDGADMELYLNGALDAFKAATGQLLTTIIDLTIGQVLPNNQSYNFNGTLDDIRIYDYGLSPQEIMGLVETGVPSPSGTTLPFAYDLQQNYPNPFNPATTIRFAVPARGRQAEVILAVYDILGRRIETLFAGHPVPGLYSMMWDAHNRASGVYYCRLETPEGTQVRKMVLVR